MKKKKADDQLILGFDETEPQARPQIRTQTRPQVKKRVEKPPLQPLDLKRAALGWLVAQKPDAISVRVPTRISKYCADVAAFWSVGRRGKLLPKKTLIIETRNNREECWPDCSRHEGLLNQLKEAKELKRSIEAKIRKNEPNLKDTDNLFNEYESWRYKESKNKEYHKCLKEIDKLERAVYNGSFFEQLRRAEVADYLYLAVPEGTVHSDELADSWGLIYVKPDLGTELVKAAEFWDCPVERKMHLAQNIAITCRKSLLFSLGIRENADGRPVFTPIPHRRRGKAVS
ncbi:MAG TPA: hypothetical protein DCZ94_01955 [Lentisphaeria bacterium]|nr:MAG: hypothetical protein A2X48_22675 [Lentisphaerae bacterium GWF2_49_21]HBC85697.1 hypothetical protein [Lentisphaeria bacterium]